MNLIEMFQDLVAQVPVLVQPIIIALAGAVPFIEGEGAVAIGILGGMNPITAGLAAGLGGFASVFVVVSLSSRARQAVRARRSRALVASDGTVIDARVESEPSARERKFRKMFDRYGVPGVCLLGPLVLPPVFTAPMLIAVGVTPKRVLAWQAVGIMLWVVVLAALSMAAVSAMV